MPPKASDTPEAENPTQSTASAPAKEGAKKKTTLSKAGAEMMSSAVKALIYIAAVFVVAIFLSIIIIRVGNDVFALVKSDEVIDITIPEEAKLSDVANILHENSIISFRIRDIKTAEFGLNIRHGSADHFCRQLQGKGVHRFQQNTGSFSKPLPYCPVGSLPEITALCML